jgi:predicted ATPase/DNA-binding winged helix-turn-helix (wHTH) protein
MHKNGKRSPLNESVEAAVLHFGHCRLFPDSGELFVGGVRAALGRRTFDILMIMIEARGALVTKDEILERAWPSNVVGENALHVQVSALRKALGVDAALVKTVPGRGYRFDGAIDSTSISRNDSPIREVRGNLPAPISPLIGRDQELFIVAGLLATYRIVTLAGMGGIGKTRLAIEAARSAAASFRDGAWLADLSAVSDARLLAADLATICGIDCNAGCSNDRLASALSSRTMLLILDNCEHLAAPIAAIAATILHGCPGVRILATSQEPLKVEGEFIYRMEPLSLPPEDEIDSAKLLTYGATRLFVSRVQHVAPHFPLDGQNAASIANLCRKLDGIPLAIELAAARATTLGLEPLISRLTDRFAILTDGSRSSNPRHRSLRTAIDWSYDLLDEMGKATLQGLSIFTAPFPLDAAVAMLGGKSPIEVENSLADLVAKSLVVAEFDGASARFRMFQTVRDYALDRLDASGDRREVSRRHASYFLLRCRIAAQQAQLTQGIAWLEQYRHCLPDVSAALDWAQGADGDLPLAAELVEAAVPLWLELSLMDEARERLERILVLVHGNGEQEMRREMRLRAALGAALTFAAGPARQMRETWCRTLELAGKLDDHEFRAAALFGLWVHATSNANYVEAMDFASQFSDQARSDMNRYNQSVAHGMSGNLLYFQGRLDPAREHFERALKEYEAPTRRGDAIAHNVIGMRIDARLAAKAPLAQVLWIQGHFKRAWTLADETMEEARASGHPISRAYALTDGLCRLALVARDFLALERYTRMLLAESEKYQLSYWGQWAHTFEATLLIARGEARRGVTLLESTLGHFEGKEPWIIAAYAALAEGLASAGQTELALAKLDQALGLVTQSRQGWYLPELLRIKGELMADPAKAEELFIEARVVAGQQHAWVWELRAALSSARRWRAQGREEETSELLRPIHARFAEGASVQDVREAADFIALAR